MKKRSKKSEWIAYRMQEEQQHLDLLERVLWKRNQRKEVRTEVLRYCESSNVSERSIWRELALYKEAGATAILLGTDISNYFADAQQKLREKILVLINKLPSATLSDFAHLVTFTEWVHQRIEYLGDVLLYGFLEREKGIWRESMNTWEYTNFFVQKLFREADMIHEMINMDVSAKSLIRKYEEWLLDKVIDEEVLI